MPLAAGSKLGPYEIASQIGEGGMGEVYRARDERLDRTVAIKVLAEELSSDPRFRRRFEREARAISQLQHPNVCTLFDVGEQDGVHYLVMEYLEGETLEHRLTVGAIPIEEALRIAGEIADAIEAAHRAGIVHRDLKPGNVMLTSTGTKVLDFGLARDSVSPGAPINTEAATAAAAVTEEGNVVGTLPYMAPEQLRGGDVDSRADVWALGCVVYEMTTGERLFGGPTRADTMGSILEQEVDLSSPKALARAPRLIRVLGRALEKDREYRWQTARDFGLELARSSEEPVEPTVLAAGSPWAKRSAIAATALLGLLLGLALGSVLDRDEPPTAGPAVRRFSINLPQDRPLLQASQQYGNNTLALSPDGQWLVYLSPGSTYDLSHGFLVKRHLGSNEVEVITGPGESEVHSPFFSPDSQWIGFASDSAQQLFKVSVDGGEPTAVARLPNLGLVHTALGATWCDDDSIFVSIIERGLYRLGPEDRQLQPLGLPVNGSFPRCLPGSDGLLFTAFHPQHRRRNLHVLDLETGESRLLLEGAEEAQYTSTGHLVLARAGALMSVPFDIERLKVTGRETNVTPSAMVSVPLPYQWSLASDGTLAFGSLPPVQSILRAFLVDPEGGEQLLDLPPIMIDTSAVLSPDGRFVAANSINHEGRRLLYVLDRDQGTAPRPLSVEGGEIVASFLPDSRRLVYSIATRAEGRSPQLNIYLSSVFAEGPPQRLTEGPKIQVPADVTPDGSTLVYYERNPETQADLYAMSLDDPWRKPQVLVQGPHVERLARFSPDGRWMAYLLEDEERSLIMVVSWPDLGSSVLVASGPRNKVSYPRWSPDGKQIYYVTPRGVETVAIRASSSAIQASAPTVVVPGTFQLNSISVTPDGSSFLLLRPQPDEDAHEIHVIQNWLEELDESLQVN